LITELIQKGSELWRT